MRTVLKCLALTVASIFVAAIALTGGCAVPQHPMAVLEESGYEDYEYGRAVDYFRQWRKAPDVDYVLQTLRLASAALAARQWDVAREAFEDATDIMDSFHTNTEVQKWVALVTNELVKVFKGEPYERAMAHWYLGMLYYRAGEYDNAAACFRNSLFKLKVYDAQNDIQVEDSAESDFALGHYFLARCYQRMRDMQNARRAFTYAREAVGPASKWITNEALNATTNVVLVIETGNGPFKTPYGPNAVAAELNPIFASRSLKPVVWVDDKKTREPALLVNLRLISAKRKWQNIDTIRYVKSMLNSGAAVAALRGAGSVDGAIARGLAIALSLGLHPDLRYWEMLPENVFVLPLHLTPGTHRLRIHYLDTRECEEEWHRQEWDQLVVPNTGERLVWVRCGPRVTGGRL